MTTWPPYGAPEQTTVAAVLATVPSDGWQRLSCGEGAQGPRWYDWAWIPLRPALRDGWVQSVLLRRHPERADELASSLGYAAEGTLLTDIVRVAGARWTIEELFKLAKGQVGRDHYEVRSWHGWYRHITLALLALAVLTVGASKKGGPACPTHIPITVPEIRRLLVRLLWAAVRTPDEITAWSRWRRHHQKVAQDCHHRRRLKRKGEL